MSVIQAGNTTTTSLIYTGDTTGNLVFTTGGANTVALTIDNTQSAKFSGTGSVVLPAGTTAQRPASPANGSARYNTSNATFEGYANGSWGNFVSSGAGVIAALGYTPSNSANQTFYSIRSSAPTNVDFPQNSWANVNTTYYKWDLPAAGNYVLWMTVRARLWGTTGYAKVRLYNNTASAAVANSDTMMIESQTAGTYLNVMCSSLWQFTATGATTLYLQGNTTAANSQGIQSDANGYNEFGWMRIS